jgi:3-oxoacyl-[acyl-carrier protein] reductase
MNYPNDLSGQIVLVTGGGRGIGRQIAEHLSKEGALVAIAARTKSQLDETIAVITENGGTAIAFQLDVTDNNDVKRVVSEITERFGAIDLLINNAGMIIEPTVSWQVDPEDWWRVLEVNVRGAFLCTHAVLERMIERNQGRIINIGSNVGIKSPPMFSAYGASKATLLHFSNTIGEEVKETNVSIFTISPGTVHTDLTKDIQFFKNLPDTAFTPIERVAEICAILGSGIADKLSGRYIHVRDDDLSVLIERADEIIEKDAQVLQLSRLAK